MMMLKTLLNGGVGLVVVLWIVGSAHVASAAVSIDFESPTYTTGGLTGQDGFAKPNYAAGPGMNVVSSGALAGAQSANASGDFNNDVYRHMEAYTDGPGIDFNTSLLWKADGGESIFGISANNGLNGASPVALRILVNDIQYTGLGDLPYWTNFSNGAGAYTPGDIQEFLIGVDIGAANYTVSWRDVTTSGAFSTPQTVPMWSLSAASDRPTSGVVNDITLAVRSGAVSFDNITMTGTAAGVPGDYNGNGTVDGADYVLWRKGVAPLQNEVAAPLGTTNSADYDAWRARFGNTSGSGAASGANAAVPEPTSMLICVFAIFYCGMSVRSRTRVACHAWRASRESITGVWVASGATPGACAKAQERHTSDIKEWS